MKASCIAFITDFGINDPFVGMMKAVILGIAPRVPMVDITHSIPPQDLSTAGFYLMVSLEYFPKGTIFVTVVDPLVGTGRGIIWARTRNHQFIVPDNGVIGWVKEREKMLEARFVQNTGLFLPKISSTFHGRDIIAPVAARLAAGLSPAKLGPVLKECRKTAFPRASRSGNHVYGKVIAVDHFGNAITNILREYVTSHSIFRIKDRVIGGMKITYASAQEGETMALTGSFGFVEFSVRNGNFAAMFGVKAGDPAEVLVSLDEQ
ncbi:MAG: SAM-dependent chlorinase/fluorinase [bacterium]